MTLGKKRLLAVAVGMAFAAAGAAQAAAPDWSKVPAKQITAFYPGASPMEWIMKGSEHGGARALKKGETCASCHNEEAADSHECRNCHGFESMNTEVQKPRAKKAHELGQRDKQTCIDCHKGIAHTKPQGMTEADEG